jgi:hypothetical protein
MLLFLIIGCKPFYSLVEPIEVDAYLEILNEFEINLKGMIFWKYSKYH